MPEWNDRNRPLYMIGVAAELAGVHPQTLRAYEQKGLVTPQRTSGTPMANATMKPTPAKVIPSCPMPECPNFPRPARWKWPAPAPPRTPALRGSRWIQDNPARSAR